jgi:undecaprenyl-diphosphatase
MKRDDRYTGPERRTAARKGMEGALDPVFDLLRWIGRHVRGFHAAVGLFLVIGLGIMLLAVLAFAGIAVLVAEGVTQRFDNAVLLWLNRYASPALDAAALEVTALGSGFVTWMLILLASVFLWTTHHRYSAVLAWVALLGGALLNSVLKSLFDRPRPDLFEWRTPYAGHSSFPSGHSMTAMSVYAILAYLIVRLEPSRRVRRLTLGVFAVVVILVGISRLYLGVHYPSDVIAGFLIGFVWATFCALGLEAVRYFRGRRPDAAAQERDLERGTEPIRDAVEAHPEERPAAADGD